MGKKGEELRLRKSQTVYSFTREQLIERDRAIIEDYKKRYNETLIKELKKERKKMDEEAEKLWAQDRHDLFFEAMKYYCTMGCKVLIEVFPHDFKPMSKNCKLRKDSRLMRFVNAVVSEIIELSEKEIGIEEYREKVYNDYGIKFNWSDEEDAENQN